MSNIPKIVQERLKAQGYSADHGAQHPGAHHPDADLLTAFSEKSLPERERSSVLEHLAQCSDCREIVALALPEIEPAELATRYSVRPWFTWPAVRWGFITAGLAAIALFGVLQYQRHSVSEMTNNTAPSAPATVARNEPQPGPAEQHGAQEADKARDAKPQGNGRAQDNLQARASTADLNSRNAGLAGERTIRRDQAAAVPEPAPVAKKQVHAFALKTLPHGPLTNQLQQNANNMVQAPASAPSPVAPNAKQLTTAQPTAAIQTEANSEMVQVQAPSTTSSDSASESVNELVVKNEPYSPQLSQSGHDETKIDRAKPAMGGAAVKAMPDSDAAPLPGRSPKALLATNPRWSINSTGSLQRSFDQGTTWQDVDVNKAYGYAGSTSLEVSSSRSKAKDSSQSGSLKGDKKQQSALPIFRTVTANGADVWAGGAAGLLFHSTDAGAHWARIVPSSAGMVLMGDILSMEFPDPEHGRLSTSTGETWTTADAGKTWLKQ